MLIFKNTIFIIIIAAAIVIGWFWFVKTISNKEEIGARELKSNLYLLNDFLEEVSSNKKYVNNKNFPTGILESGLGQIKNMKENLEKLNNLQTKKEKFTARVTLGFSGVKDNKYPGTEKALAISKNIEDETNWWVYFQKGIRDIMAYNVEADLQNRSVTEGKKDFIFRLYLAKDGLLRSVGNLETISNLSKEKGNLSRIIFQEEDLVKTIDLLIIATDKNKINDSNRLRAKYLEEAKKLNKNLGEFSTRVYADNRFQVLAVKLGAIISAIANSD